MLKILAYLSPLSADLWKAKKNMTYSDTFQGRITYPTEREKENHPQTYLENMLPSLKLTYPLKMDGWKTSFLFGMAHFQVLCNFQGR